ncbi:MAG: VWA domain-containing protein [Phycisphaerales bacterium]|nr:VWA domain-containing protein [Phycisphaerales bacterium]
MPELTVPTGGMTSSDASQNPSGTAEPPVFRDGGTGTSDEQSPDSLGAGGTSDAEPGSDESTAGEHAASGVDSGSEDGGESLPVIAGSADAFNVPGERAKDADWAVHPESIEEAGGTQVEQEGHGGGLAGDSTGGLAGASGGGSDGSGEGQGGGGIPTEAVEAPDNGDMVEQQPGPTSMTAAGTPGNGDEPEDGSIGGQTDETAARDELPTHSQPEVLEAPGSSEEPSPNGAEVLKPDERSPTLPATPTVEQRGLPQVESPPRGSIPLSPSDLVELTSPPQPMGSESWYRQVRGAWQLVAIHDPHLDFLPGGASQRFIGIDPEGEVLRAILAWNGDLAFTVAAEYYVGFRPRIVDIQPVPHAPSKFTDPGPLVGDGTFVPAISKPPCELQWVRTGDRLTIGGGEYQAVAPDAMIELLSQPEPIDVLSGGFAGMSGEGERAGPAAATVDFFGVQAEGKYFCYIVDVSASMAGNGGMLRLRTELERSLASLPPGTRFSVLPFSDTLRDLQSQWTSANASKVRSIGHRLSGIRAAGGTNPTGAFTWAFQKLKPQPDAIFFMTDGNMGGGAGDVLTQLNRLNASNPRTRIHTIGLGDNADISFLERVAEKHGGTYRSVH